MNAPAGNHDDASDDACVMTPMTRPKSLTQDNRRQPGKRVIRVIRVLIMTRPQVDADARARNAGAQRHQLEHASQRVIGGPR